MDVDQHNVNPVDAPDGPPLLQVMVAPEPDHRPSFTAIK
jgi:hypothetical protein